MGVKSIFKKLNIVGTGNSFSKCTIWGGEETIVAENYKHLADTFIFGVRGYTDDKLTSYTLPAVRRCIKILTTSIEKNLSDIVIG